jgi:hypothetical protein
MPGRPRRDDTESDDTKRDDTRGCDVRGGCVERAVLAAGRQLKMWKRSAPQRGRKKKYEKISSSPGGTAGTPTAPVGSSAGSEPALTFVHSLRVF